MRHRKGAYKELKVRWGDAPGPAQRKRLVRLTALCIAGFVFVLGRLAQLHLFPGHELTEEERLHIGRLTLDQPRGSIRDRSGMLLATNRRVPSVWIDPRQVDKEKVEEYVAALVHHFDVAEDAVRRALMRRDANGNIRKFNMLRQFILDMTEDEVQAIVDELPGVNMDLASIRYYPQGDIAAHVVGYVTRNGEFKQGIESRFDELLHSEPGHYMARKDRDARLLPSLTLEYVRPEGGADVYLTIDTAIQYSLESALDRRMEETGASSSMGIVMDPKTGAILALANRPAFDPNDYDRFPAERKLNMAVTGAFEPGSVFKIVAAAAAIEQGLVTPDTLIDCENGSFNPYGHRIRDFYSLGVEPFSETFAQSSNVAIIKVAALLGKERFDDWIRTFGFGQRSSRHLPREASGLYAGTNQSRLSMGSLPMGQEIAVTMPQLARAFAVIANGGYLVEPYLVDHALDREGKVVFQHEPLRGTRIISTETAKTMQELSHLVTLTGTGRRASIPEYRVGGKTGTAQIAKADGGGYYSDKYNTVFAGFAPVADPQLVSVIVVSEPTIRMRYGGYVCGPIFKEVVRDALIRMGVPQDPVQDPDGKVVSVKDTAELVAAAEKVIADEEPVLDADTVMPRIDPELLDYSPHALLEPLDGLELVVSKRDHLAAAGGVLPDLRGLSKVQVRERLYRLGVPWDPQGAGWVVRQDPPPGTPLSEVTLCALKFGAKADIDGDDPQRNL